MEGGGRVGDERTVVGGVCGGNVPMGGTAVSEGPVTGADGVSSDEHAAASTSIAAASSIGRPVSIDSFPDLAERACRVGGFGRWAICSGGVSTRPLQTQSA